jgi:hypothetical protein
MKIIPLLAVTLFLAVVAQAQPLSQIINPQQSTPPVAGKELVNYLIRVDWKDPKGDPKFLEVLTTEGGFELDTMQKNSVKINNNDVPVTLKFTGTLTDATDKKCRLQMFLGRTVPYVTGTSGLGSSMASSYSQMQVGLQSTFVVKFDKPVVIQNDENGEISVLVKRMD